MTSYTKNRRTVPTVTLLSAARWVTGGKIACRALVPELVQALSRLERLRTLCQTAFKVRLRPVVRADWSLKSLKEFCEGILDGSQGNEWRSSLLKQHAGRRERVSVASSLFLFRKMVPKTMTSKERRTREREYIVKMTTPDRDLDPDFAECARREMAHLFKSGWDRSWEGFRDSFTLPTRSCLERPRSKGGARGGMRAVLRMEYENFTVAGKECELGLETVPMIIWTNGKWRLVTKFSSRRSFLGPLHRTIYGHISRFKWLLRGEATREVFRDFGRKKGEVFVSGDYESATDNLNIHLTELMLDCMSRTSQTIPPAVWAQARRCLRNVFPNGKVQARGQLMGSLLSFPLLCLSNYITFRYSIPRRGVPVKINGDDIVFRCTPAEKERWFEGVAHAGLVVSKGKTLVASGGFSLNSTFFLARFGDVEECPVIRSSCLFGGVEDPNQIAGRLQGVYRGGGIVGEQIRSLALREMSKQIWRSQRSLRRGLGAMLSWRTIAFAGMEARENFYSSLASEPPLPLSKKQWSQDAVPEGYHRVPISSTKEKGDDPDFYRDMIECCWSRDPRVGEKQTGDEYWTLVRDGTYTYVPPLASRWARLAGITDKEWKSRRVVRRGGDYHLDKRENTPRPEQLVWAKRPEGEIAFRGAT